MLTWGILAIYGICWVSSWTWTEGTPPKISAAPSHTPSPNHKPPLVSVTLFSNTTFQINPSFLICFLHSWVFTSLHGGQECWSMDDLSLGFQWNIFILWSYFKNFPSWTSQSASLRYKTHFPPAYCHTVVSRCTAEYKAQHEPPLQPGNIPSPPLSATILFN